MAAQAILIGLLAFAAIIGFGLWMGDRVSSPRTKALTSLVSAHRFKGADQRAASLDAAFSIFGVGEGASAEQVQAMLEEARVFDMRYGRFHWGVLAEKLLLEDCVRRGLLSAA